MEPATMQAKENKEQLLRRLALEGMSERDRLWLTKNHTKAELVEMLMERTRLHDAALKVGKAAVAVQEDLRRERNQLSMKLTDTEQSLAATNRMLESADEETSAYRRKAFNLETDVGIWSGRVKDLIREVDRQEGMIRMLRWTIKAVARGIGEGLSEQTDTDAAVTATEYDARQTIKEALAELASK